MKLSASAFTTALVAMATNFVNLTETRQNAVWEDLKTKESEKDKSDLLVREMRKVSGWGPGDAYCAAFDGAMVNLTFDKLGFPDAGERFLKKWTAHCMTNVRALKGLLSDQPSAGALMLMRHGESDSGHAAIVADVDGEAPERMLATIEGNTNSAGSREGDGIYLKARNVYRNGNLKTQGFLPAARIIELAGIELAA